MPSINPFLDRFSNDERFSLPLPFMWEVFVIAEGLPGRIRQSLEKYGMDWPVDSPSNWGDGGSLVAQDVVIPVESAEFISLGQENRGGWMPGYGVVQRTDFLSRSLTINFIETSADIETKFFRPWVIAVANEGLLRTNLRGTIVVNEYRKDNKKRKTYRFKGAFPTNVEGYNLQYGDSEFIIKTVTFGYEHYNLDFSL